MLPVSAMTFVKGVSNCQGERKPYSRKYHVELSDFVEKHALFRFWLPINCKLKWNGKFGKVWRPVRGL